MNEWKLFHARIEECGFIGIMKKRFGKNQGVCGSLNAYRIGLGKKMNLVENHASCKKISFKG